MIINVVLLYLLWKGIQHIINYLMQQLAFLLVQNSLYTESFEVKIKSRITQKSYFIKNYFSNQFSILFGLSHGSVGIRGLGFIMNFKR